MRSCACAQPAPNHIPAAVPAVIVGTPYLLRTIVAPCAPDPTCSVTCPAAPAGVRPAAADALTVPGMR